MLRSINIEDGLSNGTLVDVSHFDSGETNSSSGVCRRYLDVKKGIVYDQFGNEIKYKIVKNLSD